ncbi:MAG: DsbC family protein [Betaproteobacteria bacterium]|nr:DsbC family protein [Betaproteobacteria bacterium]
MFIRILTVLSSVLVLLSGVACADEASIRAEFSKKYPQANIESITKTPYLGLYEMLVDGEVLYTDPDFNYLIVGSIIETKTRTNITDARQREIEDKKLKGLAFPFEQLPFELAIKKVKGDGSRKVAVFSDPDCPFCRKLEKDLEKVTDVTIYIFLFPIEQLHPKAPEMSRAIWCASDRVKAWDEYMLKGSAPKSAKCDNPVDKIVTYGQSKKINGTPTIFFADGKRVPGAIPAERFEELLNKSSSAGKS